MTQEIRIQCPTCEGDGILQNINDGAICPQCSGSGKVKMVTDKQTVEVKRRNAE